MRASLGQFAAEAGDVTYGLAQVRQARGRLPDNAPQLSRIWLDAVEARVLAERGDLEALVLLRGAEQALTRCSSHEPVWPWIFKFDEPKLAAFRAICTSRLGLISDARSAFAEATAASHSPKQSAALQAERARVLWADSEAEAACSLAATALETAHTLGSERVRQLVGSLRTDIGDGAGRAVAVLDERLGAAYEEEA
jgi:hypothetical protein